MTQRCTNCGAELFAGQQFCRRCGARTTSLEGEAPTQILADAQPQPPPPPLSTTALPSQRHTGNAAWGPRPTGPQTPFASFAHTSPLAHDAGAQELARPSKKRRWLPTLVFGLLLVGAVGVALIVLMIRSVPDRVVVLDREGRADAAAAVADGPALDETGAVVTADETVITKTFEVGDGAVFSLKNTQGDISVQGWDEERIEVKLTKRGGTAEDRREARVTLRQEDELLSLASAERSQVKVFYEVKLPRSLERVELSSRSGDVKVSRLAGALAVNLQNGDVQLDDVRGPIAAKLVNGDIDVVYRNAEREGTHEFTNVNGDVSVRLADGMEADLSASVVNGRIEVDDGLGFQAQKRTPGWYVDARLGDGGEPLSVKSVNGSIKFRK